MRETSVDKKKSDTLEVSIKLSPKKQANTQMKADPSPPSQMPPSREIW